MSTVVARLRNALSGTFLYRPVRALYNTVALYGAKRTVRLGGLNVAFRTPTFKIRDDLERLQEKELLLSFLDATQAGDVVWDVGANTGLYTLFAARAVTIRGRVIAFEPEPKTRRLLERNIALNRITNITVLPYALDNKTGVRTLFPSATPNPGSHSFVQRTDYRVKRTGVTVETITGESLITKRGVPAPQILKIDVEGAEMNVLQGMNSVLKKRPPRILIVEVHPNVLPLFGASADDIDSLLRSWNFNNVARIQRGTEFHLLCRGT